MVATRLSSPKSWHEVPGKEALKRSVPEGRDDWRLLRMRRIFATSVSSRFESPRSNWHHACNTSSYRPYRTGHNLPQFQALRARTSASSVESLPSICPSGTEELLFQSGGWGINPSREMLNKARSQEAEVIWTCAAAENTGLTNIQFDFVFNVDAIHHFQDRGRVFSEINRILLETGTLCIATDSEDIIRNRTPLSTYWPETVELELARYPRIDALEIELRETGFVELKREEVSATRRLSDPTLYRAKVFSALRLLPESTFERGLNRLEADLARGPIRSISRYLLLWAKR